MRWSNGTYKNTKDINHQPDSACSTSHGTTSVDFFLLFDPINFNKSVQIAARFITCPVPNSNFRVSQSHLRFTMRLTQNNPARFSDLWLENKTRIREEKGQTILF